MFENNSFSYSTKELGSSDVFIVICAETSIDWPKGFYNLLFTFEN